MKTFYTLLFLVILFICCSSDKYETIDVHIISNYKTLSESVVAGDGSFLNMSYIAWYDKQTDNFFIEVRSIDYLENLTIENPVFFNGSEHINLEASVPEADDFNDQVFKIFLNHDVFKSLVENGYYIFFRVLKPVMVKNTFYISKTVKEKEDLLELFNNIDKIQ